MDDFGGQCYWNFIERCIGGVQREDVVQFVGKDVFELGYLVLVDEVGWGWKDGNVVFSIFGKFICVVIEFNDGNCEFFFGLVFIESVEVFVNFIVNFYKVVEGVLS